MIPKSGIELKKISVYVSIACIIIGGVVVRPLTLLAFLCCIAIVFFKNSRSDLYSFFFFLMPFASIFKLSSGSTSLLTYVLLIFELKLILSERRLPKSFLAAWLLYSIYVIVGMGNAYTDAIKQAMIPVFFFFGMKKECRNYIRTHSLMYSNDDQYADEVLIGKTPEEFVNLIRNADYVLTDSFHGLAFSVIHEKQFLVFYRRRMDVKESRNSRIDNIVRLWGIEERLIRNPENMQMPNSDIDYDSVNDKVAKLRVQSFAFLTQALMG